jgi:hypothetical protein
MVPKQERKEWLEEWGGELAYILTDEGKDTYKGLPGLSFSIGAFPDALWFRRNHAGEGSVCHLESPVACLAFLGVLAGITGLGSLVEFGARLAPFADLYRPFSDQSFANFPLQVAMAVLVLPATTSLSLGEYFAEDRSGWGNNIIWRNWAFLVIKTALALTIAYYGGLDLTHLSESFALLARWSGLYQAIRTDLTPIQPLATFGLLLGAFRWMLRDQQQRCPACLRLLSNPAVVGQRSRNFLEWNGTESICRSGHGLLHIPEIATSWFGTHRWLTLDASWQQLFSKSAWPCIAQAGISDRMPQTPAQMKRQ